LQQLKNLRLSNKETQDEVLRLMDFQLPCPLGQGLKLYIYSRALALPVLGYSPAYFLFFIIPALKGRAKGRAIEGE